MNEQNDRISKWTWDKFSPNAPPEPVPEPVQDPDAIRALVSYPDAEAIDVFFFPIIGSAFVVITGCDVDEVDRRLGMGVNWDVHVVSASEFAEIKRTADKKFRSVNGIPESLIPSLIANGFFEFDDLNIADPDWLASHDGITETMADDIIDIAEKHSEILGDSTT